MKRLYLTFITDLFLCAIAYAKDINVGGFHYRILNDEEVAVIGAEVNDTVLRIPSTVSTFTLIVEIVAVLFAINHAYVELINNTAANNKSNSETFKFDFFCFFVVFIFTLL